MIEFRTLDVIEHYTAFDADWYGATYPDAGLIGMTPRQHYAAFGHYMGRSVSADSAELTQIPGLADALARKPKLSYCTPIMNRPDDIKGTLGANIEANRPYAAEVEFVIVFMDEDRETHDWVRQSFPEELKAGYLRMIVEPALDGWHFGKAKNRHKNYAIGEIYSSLDGDNFVTAAETEQLLDLMAAHPKGFLFHHFTGNWGDGSSGRITLPTWIYRSIGYDENFMPRQFDEMDVLLSAMLRFPQMPLIRIQADNHGFASKRSRTYFAEVGVSNPLIEIASVERCLPLNPKSDTYVSEDTSMEAMTTFNQGVCFLKNAPNQKLRDKYLKLAVQGRHAVLDAVPPEKILGTLFWANKNPVAGSLEIGPDDVCIVACMKNDHSFLQPFYDHYKALGVKYFFIVDDGSAPALADSLPYPDVFIFHPKVGTFLTAKGLWMEGMAKAYLAEGQWMLTLDADEFIDLPQGFSTLPELTRFMRARGQETMPALLIDLLPAPDTSPEAFETVETDFQRLFDHHVWVEAEIAPDYANYAPIKWAFGDFVGLSWRLDTRYHAYGTFDSLRKIPLIQFRAGRHINQGFHTLHYNDGTPNPGAEIWDTDLVLPIRHYKMIKLFSQASRERMAAMLASSKASQYHARTAENIAKIFGSGNGDSIQQAMSLPSRPIADSLLTTLDPRSFGKLMGADIIKK